MEMTKIYLFPNPRSRGIELVLPAEDYLAASEYARRFSSAAEFELVQKPELSRFKWKFTKKKSFRIGRKIVPQLLGANVGYVTPFLNHKLSVSINYSSLSRIAGDPEYGII